MPEKHNNFDAIRIVAAFAVLFSHHFALTAQVEPSFLGLHSWGGTAVIVFFVISGYLVTASWYNDPHFLRFSQRRILRIWPALMVVTVITAYGLGAWVTTLPLAEYWTNPATLDYLLALKMRVRYVLPGVFEYNPYPQGVNGSLWTIPLEVRCYVVLALAGLLGLMRSRKIWLLLIAIYIAWFLTQSSADMTGKIHHGRELSAFFLAGSALFIFQPRWEQHPLRWLLVLGAGATLVWLGQWHNTALLILVPFLVVYAGTRSTPVIRRLGRWGDPSYGIYLIAYPVQQTVIHLLWPRLGFVTTLGLAAAITIVLAYASWHFIEKQALRLKPQKANSSRNTSNALRAVQPNTRLQNQIRTIFSAAWLGWMLVTAIKQVIKFFPSADAGVNGDAYWTYLPNARHFLSAPWTYWTTDPSSFYVAPLGYIWPALWGADPVATQLANGMLYLISILLMWRLATRLGGLVAGIVATALLVRFPDLATYIPQVLTEPPYMFGLMLFLTGATEYVLTEQRRGIWLAMATSGLAITLLTRPVLQLFAVIGLVALISLLAWLHFKPTAHAWRRVINRQTIFALIFSLSLPALTLLKNGMHFDHWGISSGTGSGLFYGVSPFKMGVEPIYGGFGYDAGVVSQIADSSTQGHPLRARSDHIQSQAAFNIIRSTSWKDNVAFFTFKLKAWLFYATEESIFQPKLRRFRLFEWLAIICATAYLAFHQWGARKHSHADSLVLYEDNGAKRRLGLCAFILLLALGMIGQLVPVLYNMRYNTFLVDLLLIPLAGVGISLVARGVFSRVYRSTLRNTLQIISAIALTALLMAAAGSMTRWTARHAAWSMDPLRPGPTQLVLGPGDMGTATMQHGDTIGHHTWRITTSPSTLSIPLRLHQSLDFLDGIWRFKLALTPPSSSRECNKVTLVLDEPSPEIAWYTPKPTLYIRPDGTPHIYAIRGNGPLRPAATGNMNLVFNCPAGTIVHWQGAQLLRSTMAEATHALITTGTAIDPYRADDIQ